MSVKEKVLELYPNVVFKNELFLNDDTILNDFSLEDVAFRLSQLDNNSAWFLDHYLNTYNNAKLEKDLIKFLIKNDIDYFKENVNAEKFQKLELIREFEKIYSSYDFTLDSFKEVMSENETNNSNKNFYQHNISHLKCIIMLQKLYKDKKIKIGDANNFISFLVEILMKDTIKVYGNYNERFEKYINEAISFLIDGKISLVDYSSSLFENNILLELLVNAKFENITIASTIPIDVLMALKSKRVNMFVDKIVERDIGGFDRNRITKIVINMCALLGEVNVDNLIRTMPDDNYKIRRLLFAFSDIDISKVVVNDRRIELKEEFVSFFMGNKLNDSTSLVNLIYNGETSLGSYVENMYYSFEQINARYKDQHKMSKKVFFENFFSTSKFAFNPDEIILEGNIINSYFDVRKHQTLKPVDFVKEVRECYGKMKHLYRKTIPYVSGQFGEYHYETLMANDPEVLAVGAATNCCFKIGGQADGFVKYCALNKNARVLVVRNIKGVIVAAVPMVRNGNLILCNSIESPYVKSTEFMKTMFELLEHASRQFIDISASTESVDSSIMAVLCGNYKNELDKFNKYKNVGSGRLYELSPLGSTISCNMGIDSSGFYCINSVPWFDMDDFRSFNPSVDYADPRKKTLELEVDCLSDDMLVNIQKKIDAISYEAKYGKVDLRTAMMVICNDDWFIVIDNKMNIFSCIVGDDPRALQEFNEFLELEREYYSSYNESVSSGKRLG